MDIELSPNWSPLIAVLILGVVCVFLFLAMRRQMKRMHANWEAQDAADRDPDDTDPR